MTEHVQDLYKCTPREARGFIADVIEAGLVPFLESSPGAGKSSIIKSVAGEFGLKVIDERLSTRSPVDLAGIPDFSGQGVSRRATFTPFDVYPLDTDELPEGMNGWALFLDEFNSASKATQAAAYKLVLDRESGLRKLHSHVAIICAGNLATDRAITNPLSTAMQSRVVHIEMEVSFNQWLEDVALKQDYDSRLIAYLSYKPSYLMDFDPAHNEKTFCCPRTWEFMNKLINGKPIPDDKIKLFAGTITSGVAVDFVTFLKVYKNMPNITQILADPANMFVPGDNATRWAVITHLMEKTDAKNFKDICTYINRFDSGFRVLFFRSILVRQPEMRTHPEFAKAMSELSRYLNGD